MDFESWCSDSGFESGTLSEVQRKRLLSAWKADQAPAPEPAPKSFDSILAARHADEEREGRTEAKLTVLLNANPPRITAELAGAIRREAAASRWDDTRVDLELLRAERPQAGVYGNGREAPLPTDVLECAVCTMGKLSNLETAFDPRTLEASRRHFRHGLGLAELVLTCARQNGYRGISLRSGDLRTVLQAAFHPDIRAGDGGPSTYDLSGILSNIANKFLRVAFEGVDDAWRQITATRSVNDFKTITSYSLTGDLQYELVPPGGELKHGQLSSISYTNKADTYAKLFGIDRRDLINDDLSALSRVGTRMGRGGALKINDIFWAEFLNNSAFFSSGNLNVLTGVTAGPTNSALSLEGLQNADRVFRLQTDPDGKPLGMMARLLLVPTQLRITALNLMNSTIVVASTTADRPLPNANAFANAYSVVSSPYMSNAAYTGNSATAWYLLSSPSDMPAVETVFLNGAELPTVDSSEADINQLGITFRGVHDFGCKKQEFRSGVRAAGA